VRFLARGAGYTVFLTAQETVLTLRPPAGPAAALRLRLEGAAPDAPAAGEAPLPGRVSYFRGPDPSGWRAGAPTFARVRQRGVYPGIDLVHYGIQGQLEYDFVFAPGADPDRIALAAEGADGVELEPGGDLVLRAAGGGEVRQRAPVLYQDDPDGSGARRTGVGPGGRWRGATAGGRTASWASAWGPTTRAARW
jgi:hypothetical protein